MKSKVRIDKWLWSIRIYKTRTLATNAIRSGKVRLNDQNTKASSLIQLDDTVIVKKNGFNLTIKALQLIEKRVGAKLAVECYENLTPVEELNKYKNWYIGKAQSEWREKGMGRPTKKERREIDDFKEEYYWDDEHE